MKTIYFLLLCFGITLNAQQARWFSKKDLYNFESNSKTTYVTSATNPCIINHLEETFQMVPNGPVIQPVEYAMAYDTSGTELWSKKLINQYHGLIFPAQVIKFLSKEDDKFWMVLGAAGDTLKIGNQFLTSPYNDTLYNSIYFVQMNRSGAILNYFTYAFKLDVEMYLNDIAFDLNGDFILAGVVKPNINTPNPYTSRPFSFGTYSGTLYPDQRKNFIARLHANGTEGDIFQFDSHMPMFWTYKNISVIQKVAINTLNGNVVFAGILGDTLSIQSNTMINTSPSRQLFLGMLNSNLNYLSSKSETVATSGTFLYALTFNPVSNAFYFTGSWDGYLNYGQPGPLAGGNGFIGNDSFIAKLQSNSLNVDSVIPIFPVPHTNNTLALCLDLAVSKDGSVYAAGFTEDSVIAFAGSVYHLNNPNWNEFPFLLKLSPNLAIDTALFASTSFLGRFNNLQIHKNAIYCGGCFNGSFSMNTVGGTSAYQLDAFLLRIDVNAPAYSDFTLPLTPVCKSETVTPENMSWGQPVPTYSWSATPSAGVTFSPSAFVALPQILFGNSGNYTIHCLATNSLGSSVSDKSFSVAVCAGLNAFNLEMPALIVAPNPSSGMFELSNFSKPDQSYELLITNALGQKIMRQVFKLGDQKSWVINLPDQKPGIYFLELLSGGNKETRKLVIKN